MNKSIFNYNFQKKHAIFTTSKEGMKMDMDELGFFIFMEEQERKEKEQQEESSNGEG